MPNFQNFDQTSDSTLAKLLEVDSELVVQEEELLSQLESIQEKRRSLKTVISLFTEADTPATTSVEEPTQTPYSEIDGKLEAVDQNSAAPSSETSEATTAAELETEAPMDTQSNGAQKKTSSPARSTKTTRPSKNIKKALGWQDYVREEFSKVSLVEAVTSVLQRRSNEVLEIPAIVNAIFVNDLPKEAGYKARRQVTNILSDGARKNKWYRGQSGYYSMSRAAAQASAS